MTTELLTFRACNMSIAWRLAANWCRQHGRIATSVRQEWAGAGCRRLRVESVPSAEQAVFAQWAHEDAKARKSRGIPIIAKKVLEARDKAMAEADKQDVATRRDFEIAMRSRYDGQGGPWAALPWAGDSMVRGVGTAPLSAEVVSVEWPSLSSIIQATAAKTS